MSLIDKLRGMALPEGESAKIATGLHLDKHPLDVRPLRGTQRVRVDGGNSMTPGELRSYVYVASGFGEGARAAMARRRFAAPLQRGGLS